MPPAPPPLDVGALIKEHTGVLYAGALGLGFPPSEAEELVQATFVSFLDALSRFEGRSSVRTYLFGILYNKASETRRKASREQASDEIEQVFESRFDARGLWMKPPQGPEDEALAAEVQALVEKCAESLPEAQRMAFFLKEVQGAGSEEACNVLGVSATNLRVLLFRARNRLRECLERSWGGRK